MISDIVQELTAYEFLYMMTDEDLQDVVRHGDLEKFCNAITLDMAELKYGTKKSNEC